MENKKILPSVVSTKQLKESDWRKQIEEINKMGLEEVALFPTCLEKRERKELYKILDKSSIKTIPLVHLRNDMNLDEMDYFIENYNTKVFCTHSASVFPFLYDYLKYKDIISIENTYNFLNGEEIKNFGGICLDFTHLENDRLLHKKEFKTNLDILEKYPILSNHIGAVRKVSHINKEGNVRYDYHHLKDLSELDYLKRYPLNYFSSFIAIELENSIKEQLAIKDYIEKILLDIK